jgi:hypothetical protein
MGPEMVKAQINAIATSTPQSVVFGFIEHNMYKYYSASLSIKSDGKHSFTEDDGAFSNPRLGNRLLRWPNPGGEFIFEDTNLEYVFLGRTRALIEQLAIMEKDAEIEELRAVHNRCRTTRDSTPWRRPWRNTPTRRQRRRSARLPRSRA